MQNIIKYFINNPYENKISHKKGKPKSTKINEKEENKQGKVIVRSKEEYETYKEINLSVDDLIWNIQRENLMLIKDLEKYQKNSKIIKKTKLQIIQKKYIEKVNKENYENYKQLLPPPESQLSEEEKWKKKNN